MWKKLTSMCAFFKTLYHMQDSQSPVILCVYPSLHIQEIDHCSSFKSGLAMGNAGGSGLTVVGPSWALQEGLAISASSLKEASDCENPSSKIAVGNKPATALANGEMLTHPKLFSCPCGSAPVSEEETPDIQQQRPTWSWRTTQLGLSRLYNRIEWKIINGCFKITKLWTSWLNSKR